MARIVLGVVLCVWLAAACGDDDGDNYTETIIATDMEPFDEDPGMAPVLLPPDLPMIPPVCVYCGPESDVDAGDLCCDRR